MIEILQDPNYNINSRALKVLKDPYFKNCNVLLFDSLVSYTGSGTVRILEVNGVPAAKISIGVTVNIIDKPVSSRAINDKLSHLLFHPEGGWTYATERGFCYAFH